jgi:hypothetical protein
MRRRQLPIIQEEKMRKKGENSVKRAGKSCDSTRPSNDFTLGFESQSVIKSD